MKILSVNYFDDITTQVQAYSRKLQHRNFYESYEDQGKRFFNAIEPVSYIQPYRHVTDPRDELLIAVRGAMDLMTFDNDGKVIGVVCFGARRHSEDLAVIAEVPASTRAFRNFFGAKQRLTRC